MGKEPTDAELFAENDFDAECLIVDFEEGLLTFSDLKYMVGGDAAKTIISRINSEPDTNNPDSYFDDPSSM